MKVEYAFESARARVYLPTFGETWFSVSQRMTTREFLDEIKSQDPHVEEVHIVDEKFRELSNEDSRSCMPC